MDTVSALRLRCVFCAAVFEYAGGLPFGFNLSGGSPLCPGCARLFPHLSAKRIAPPADAVSPAPPGVCSECHEDVPHRDWGKLCPSCWLRERGRRQPTEAPRIDDRGRAGAWYDGWRPSRGPAPAAADGWPQRFREAYRAVADRKQRDEEHPTEPEVAGELGISRATLQRRLTQFGMRFPKA